MATNNSLTSKYDDLNEKLQSLTNRFETFHDKIIDVFLSIDGSLITMLDEPSIGQYMCAVKQNGLLIEYVPEDKRTLPLIDAAINSNPDAIKLLNIDTVHLGYRIIDLDVKYVKLMRCENVQDPGILKKLQEYAIMREPSIILELVLIDWSSWIIAINKEPELIDRMPSKVFTSISDELIAANAHAVAASTRFPQVLTVDQVEEIIGIVPYDTDDLLSTRFADRCEKSKTFDDIDKGRGRLWRKAFTTAPSMLKYVENFVSCPEEDEFYIELMDKIGIDVVKNLPDSMLKHPDIEFAIISKYSKEKLTEIGYKPSRLINKIRLMLK